MVVFYLNLNAQRSELLPETDLAQPLRCDCARLPN